MKANSDTKPKKFIKSRGKLFFNFNVVESEKIDEHGTRIVFDYEFVEVKTKDRKSVISAIMRDKYSTDEEFAFINNKFKNKDTIDLEYEDYQATRDLVKEIVKGLKRKPF